MPGYPLPSIRFGNINKNNGQPNANGRVHTYEPGTTTNKVTYADADMLVANTNPVVLDGFGRAAIYIPAGEPYKIVVTDDAGNVLYTEPEVEVPETAAAAPAVAFATGMMMGWPTATPPTGWAICDGSAVARAGAGYDALFALIGTTFGAGNGSTTFNLPDFRGRFFLHKAASGTGSVIGQSGGSLDHVHTGPSHNHTIPDHSHTVPGHQHSVPRDGWGSAEATPPVAGRLQAGGSGAGSESAASQATADNQTGASSALVTSTAAMGSTGTGGTGNTGAANPAFLVGGHMIIKL